MSIIKKLSFNTLVYAIGPQIPKVVSFLMLPVLTPYLTREDYGIYGILTAYTGALSMLADLGLTTVLSVTFYKYPNRFRFYWNKLFAVTTIWAIPLSILSSSVIYLALPEPEKGDFFLLSFLFCAPLIFFGPTKWIGRKFFQLAQKPLPVVSINIVSSLTGIATNYITIKVLNLGYLGWFIGGFVINLVTFIMYLYYFRKTIQIRPDFKFNYKWLKPILLIGIPVIPHYYSSYLLNSSDRMVLDFLRVPLTDIGIYTLAYTIGGYFALIGTSLADAAGPMYIELFRTGKLEDEVKARNLTFAMQAFILLTGFLAALWIKEAYTILIRNESLQEGYSMAVIILMSYVYNPMYFGPVNKLQYLYKTKELWKITFLGGTLSIIINLSLIPIIGVWAAVFSTFTSMMFIGFRGYGLKVFRENNPVNYYPVYWFLAICGTTLLVYSLKDVTVFLKMPLSALTILLLWAGWRKYRAAF